jgi:hypothetical protein
VTAPLEHGRSAGRSDRARRPLTWVSHAAARRVLIALHVAALGAVAIELIVPFGSHSADGAHAGHGVERIGALDFVASYALYGFIGCVALVLIGKLLRSAVMRDEHYYEERD